MADKIDLEYSNERGVGWSPTIALFGLCALAALAIVWTIKSSVRVSYPRLTNEKQNHLQTAAMARPSIAESAGVKAYRRYKAKIAEMIEAYIRANREYDLLKPDEECVKIRMTLQLDTPGGKPDKEEYFVRYQLKTGKTFFCDSAEFLHCTDERGAAK